MAKLVDQRTGEERQLVKPIILIGRAEYCDICLPDRVVSREHARIRRRLTGYYIEDLGSTHGTRVNNARIHRRVKLRDGDVITIAGLRTDSRTASTIRPPHTDTTTGSRKGPSRDSDTAPGDHVRIGASFIFRK